MNGPGGQLITESRHETQLEGLVLTPTSDSASSLARQECPVRNPRIGRPQRPPCEGRVQLGRGEMLGWLSARAGQEPPRDSNRDNSRERILENRKGTLLSLLLKGK